MLNLDYRNNKPFIEKEEDTYWANIMTNLNKPRISGLSHTVTLARGGGSGGRAVKKANAKP